MINNLKLFLASNRNRKRLLSNENSTGKNILETVGVIVDKAHLHTLPDLNDLAKKLGVKESNISLICATEDALPENEFSCLKASVEDLNLKGRFKDPEIGNFVNSNFDLLLCNLKDHNDFNIYLIKATSANLKIGRDKEQSKLYDLVILDNGDVAVFLAEAVKYLKILKRINYNE